MMWVRAFFQKKCPKFEETLGHYVSMSGTEHVDVVVDLRPNVGQLSVCQRTIPAQVLVFQFQRFAILSAAVDGAVCRERDFDGIDFAMKFVDDEQLQHIIAIVPNAFTNELGFKNLCLGQSHECASADVFDGNVVDGVDANTIKDVSEFFPVIVVLRCNSCLL